MHQFDHKCGKLSSANVIKNTHAHVTHFAQAIRTSEQALIIELKLLPASIFVVVPTAVPSLTSLRQDNDRFKSSGDSVERVTVLSGDFQPNASLVALGNALKIDIAYISWWEFFQFKCNAS